MNIESTPLGVECDVRHLPGRHQAKCTSKQDAGWVFQVETSCGNRDPGTIASTHSNQRGARKCSSRMTCFSPLNPHPHALFLAIAARLQKPDGARTTV